MTAGMITMPELEPQLPNEGMSFNRLQVKTGSWEDQFRGDLCGAISSAPIWHVRQKQRRFRLVCPLLVRVRRDEDFYYAENATLRLMGTGTNPEEALADFCMHLIYFQQYYTRIPPHKVAGEAIRLRRLFRKIFVEEH